METKDELVTNVREWVKLDNEMKELAKEVKLRREKKKEISTRLCEVMKSNEIDCFDLNDGQLCYKRSKSKKGLTKDSLLNILQQYFKDDGQRSEPLSKFIMENRIEVERETISRKVVK